MPESLQIDDSTSIPLSEIEIRASRSSGPGGQHANVTASRIEASFEIASSSVLSADQKRRLSARHGRLVSAVAQDARSQARNRQLALERLQERIRHGLRRPKRRRATRPTRASGERRLESKKRRAQTKRARRRPDND
ncbi:alternative ribosome rescue aminoacyl-tRNA hydrolase ArfB [soil metagenome]